MIDQPGCYEISHEAYLADPVVEPSLSASIAKTLLGYSPHHAWWEHPRLHAGYVPEESETLDLGTACHSFILEGDSAFIIIDAKDFRTNAAKDARDAARAAGKTPLLAHRWQSVQDMAHAVELQLAGFEDLPIPFTNGKPEQTLIWREGDLWFRARLDWLSTDRRTIDDLKSTAMSANPDVWGRSIWSAGHDVADAFYRRGVKALFGIEARKRFIVVENTPPFELSVLSLDPEGQALADRKVARAVGLWKACVETDRWPGYPRRTCFVEVPPWEEARLMERELREQGIQDDGRPIDEQLAGGKVFDRIFGMDVRP
jgi:hypothetical protein